MLLFGARRAPVGSKSFEYLVVGGGNAAGYVCRELAAQGVGAGKVGVISNEGVAPYERPALTKAYLHPPGAKVRARLPGFHTCVGGGGERQTAEWYGEKGIEFVRGSATGLDLAAKQVLVGGDSVAYEKLIVATGCGALRASAFGVTGDQLRNVFYLRQEADAAALVQTLESLHGTDARAVVIGGGYIGLECAAALVGWGVDTTMVLPEEHIMKRLFNAELATWLEDQMRARGVKIVKGDAATSFSEAKGGVRSVTLESGDQLLCNVAVVGVGATPNVEWCGDGLEMGAGGLVVDGDMRTSDPNVFAVGDVCAFAAKKGGEVGRCEHVDHARKSASQAAQAAVGMKPTPYNYLPYFYTRIFEYTDKPIVFNFYGFQKGSCHVCTRGEESIGAAWVFEGRVVGVLLMGSPGPTPDDARKLAELATTQPGVTADVTAIFDAAGL